MFTCCPNLMFLASPWGYIDFQTGYFADFEQFKVDIYFANFGQVRIDSICSLLLALYRSQLFYWVWVSYVAKNNPKSLHLIIILEPRIGSGTSYFEWFNQQESRTGFLIQQIGFKVLNFFSFLWQNKLYMIGIKTQKV